MSEPVGPGEAPSARAYIVRVWRSHQDGRWYASVQDVRTGERRGFAELKDLCGYFNSLIDDPSNSVGGPTGEDGGPAEA
jgi:hypothetical protein